MWVDRLLCAIVMSNTQYHRNVSAIPPLNRSYNECSDELCKKQMCEVIARNRLSHLVPSESNPIVPALFSADA